VTLGRHWRLNTSYCPERLTERSIQAKTFLNHYNTMIQTVKVPTLWKEKKRWEDMAYSDSDLAALYKQVGQDRDDYYITSDAVYRVYMFFKRVRYFPSRETAVHEVGRFADRTRRQLEERKQLSQFERLYSTLHEVDADDANFNEVLCGSNETQRKKEQRMRKRARELEEAKAAAEIAKVEAKRSDIMLDAKTAALVGGLVDMTEHKIVEEVPPPRLHMEIIEQIFEEARRLGDDQGAAKLRLVARNVEMASLGLHTIEAIKQNMPLVKEAFFPQQEVKKKVRYGQLEDPDYLQIKRPLLDGQSNTLVVLDQAGYKQVVRDVKALLGDEVQYIKGSRMVKEKPVKNVVRSGISDVY